MKEFLARLLQYLKDEYLTENKIDARIGILNNSEGVGILPTPSVIGERYLKGKIRNINFQILVKSKDNIKAIEMIDAINELLDNKVQEFNLKGLITLETYTEPAFVEYTNANEYIYTALYKAEINKEE